MTRPRRLTVGGTCARGHLIDGSRLFYDRPRGTIKVRCQECAREYQRQRAARRSEEHRELRNAAQVAVQRLVRNGMSQAEIARRLGSSRTHVNRWVHEQQLPHVPYAVKILKLTLELGRENGNQTDR